MSGFLVFGGWGRRGTDDQQAVAHGLTEVARSLPASRILSTGDHFGDGGAASVEDSCWRESFEDVYTAPELQASWFSVLGEGDHRGSVRAQIAYADRSERWNLPARYYSRFFGPEVLVAFLDTTPLLSRYQPGCADEIEGLVPIEPCVQLGWLRRTLANSGARWKIVVGHHPVFSGSPSEVGADLELVDLLHPLLVSCGVSAYLCGHAHDLEHLEADGVEYVVSGSGSEARESGIVPKTVFAYSGLGFASVIPSRGALRLRFHDEGGGVLHEHAVTESARQAQGDTLRSVHS